MEVGIKRWYDDARKWGRGNSAEECKETFESLQDLSSFLKKLEVELHKVVWKSCSQSFFLAVGKGDSNVILKKFPSVGKLLGQLYENNVVLLSDEVFQIVVRCSLLLSNCSAVQEKNLNKKAKSWVQTQLRRATTPILKNSILHHIGEFWGYTAQESLEIMLKKLVSSMCHDLEVLQGFFWNEEEREFYPQKPISGLCLKELSEFCLPLITIPQAKPLVEKILCSQKSLDLVKSCHNEGFLVSESVPQVLLHAVSLDKGLFLSYDAQVSLWKRHQPSFESKNSISDPALNPDDPSGYYKHEIVGIYEATWNPRLRDRYSCYKFCMSYGCTWHDGLMIDMFVSPHMNRSAVPRRRISFEGFTFPVQNDWEEYLIENFGEKYFEVPIDQELKESPDVFHGCEELKGSS